jgi:DNA-binding SARP family transcriptional activator
VEKTFIKTVSMLGSFRLHTSSGSSIAIKGKKNTALLARLLLEPSKHINRSDAEALLWSQRSSDQAKASLRQCLSELRKQLENIANIELQANRNDISLSLDSVKIDAEEIVDIANSDEIQPKLGFVDLCDGQFLQGLSVPDPAFEDWLSARRLEYRHVYNGILEDLLTRLTLNQDADQVAHVARKLLDADNCSSLANACLMKYHFNEQGGKAKAIEHYRNYCDNMKKELELPPDQDLRDLYEHIRTTEPGSNLPQRKADQQILTLPRSYGLSVAVFPFGEIGTPASEAGPGFKLASETRNGLSRFSWLSVASRYATADEAKLGGGYQKVSRDIDVRYVVDGYIDRSVKPGNVAIELIDIIDDLKSTICWSAAFTVDFDDPEAMKKTVAKIICQLDVKLRQKEIERVSSITHNDYSAYDCVIRAVSNIPEMTPESFHHAEKLFDRAIELDPEFAAIYTWKIYWEIFWFGQSWVKDPADEVKKANRIAREALKRDPDDALAMAMKAHFQAFVEHNFDGALVLHERAYRLNPYSSMVLLMNSFTYTYRGEPEKAIARLEELEELAEFEARHKFFYYTAKSVAHTFNREYELGARWGLECVEDTPTFTNGYKPLICCLGHLGRTEEAMQQIRDLRRLDPEFSLEQVAKVYPFYRDEDRQHYLEGLRKAGLD